MSDCTEVEGQEGVPVEHSMSDRTEVRRAEAAHGRDRAGREGLRARCPALITALFDDAALFPPGNAAMTDAVRRHRQGQEHWYAASMGPFVCPDARLFELDRTLEDARIDRLDVALTVPGGPQALADALDATRETRRVRVVAVEVPLGAAPVASVREALDRADPSVAGYVEVPAAELGTDLAARLLGARLRLKVRTGGTSAAAFPTEDAVASALTCAAGLGLPVKCTAGLHHAVRHRDPATGFEHHGFLNIMLAVHAALTAAGAQAANTRAGGVRAGDTRAGGVRAALAEQDGTAVASAVRALDNSQVTAVRTVFRSFGTCSIDEPLADLAALELLGVTA